MKFLALLAFATALPAAAAAAAAQEPQAADAAQSGQAQQAGPQAATMADLTGGTVVRGVEGEVVGTIESADAEGATITSGTHRLRLPLNNFQKDDQGLRIGATRAQFEAAAQAVTPS